MKLRIVGLLLVLFAIVAAPVHARAVSTAITVTDDHGAVITLAAPPRRIISLAPNVTEILFALGLGPRVVGVSSYSDYPKEATKLPVVLTVTSVNQEKILRLKPDLLVAAAIVPQTTVNKLRSLHLKVLMTDPHDISGILHDIRLVATACGIPAHGNELALSMQTRITAVKAAVRRAKTHPRVFYEIDSTGYTAGHGSFMDALITLAGGVNVAGSIMTPYPQLSREKILALNPDYYILGDAAYGVTPASVAKRPGFAALNAVKHHHVYPFDDNLASRPGPRIVLGLEKLAHLIHPELFRS